jgi:hypothetical protein
MSINNVMGANNGAWDFEISIGSSEPFFSSRSDVRVYPSIVLIAPGYISGCAAALSVQS